MEAINRESISVLNPSQTGIEAENQQKVLTHIKMYQNNIDEKVKNDKRTMENQDSKAKGIQSFFAKKQKTIGNHHQVTEDIAESPPKDRKKDKRSADNSFDTIDEHRKGDKKYKTRNTQVGINSKHVSVIQMLSLNRVELATSSNDRTSYAQSTLTTVSDAVHKEESGFSTSFPSSSLASAPPQPGSPRAQPVSPPLPGSLPPSARIAGKILSVSGPLPQTLLAPCYLEHPT